MPNVSLNAPTDYAAELEDIQRKRKLAELMQQQAMQPLESPRPTAQGWEIQTSPLSALAKMLQGYAGGAGQAQATERQRALAEKMRAGTISDLEKFSQTRAGTPARPAEVLPEDVAGPPMPEQAAVPGDVNKAYAGLAGSQNPMLSQAALARMLKQDEDYTLAEGGTRFRGTTPIANNPKQHPLHFVDTGTSVQPSNAMTGAPQGAAIPKSMTPAQQTTHDENQGWGEPYELGGAMVRKNSITGKVEQVVARPPQMHVNSPPAVTTAVVQDPANPQQQLTVDARTYRGGSLGSPGVIGISGKLGDAAKLENKRQFNMQGIGATIAEAESLLTNKAKPPTGSGVGAAVDYAGSLVGYNPSGSVEAQKLKAIGGALVSKMPRMEGPQSDKDVALYKEMSGMVGDATVPVVRRVAALEEVKNLWAKYERLNPQAFADRRAPSGNVVDFNSLPPR